jgi:hypothetical protein
MTKFSMMSTVSTQKATKNMRGKLFYLTIQNMSQVTYQLFTIIMWNNVIRLAPKSLKFMR